MAYLPDQREWPKRTMHLCTLHWRSKWSQSISESDHMDITQKVCVETVRKFEQGVWDPLKGFMDVDHFNAWTKTVYKSKAIDLLREKKRYLTDQQIVDQIENPHGDRSYHLQNRVNCLDAFYAQDQGLEEVKSFVAWVERSDPKAAQMLRLIFELELAPAKYLNQLTLSNADFAEILGVTENYIKDINRGLRYLQDNPDVLVLAVRDGHLQFRPLKHQRH